MKLEVEKWYQSRSGAFVRIVHMDEGSKVFKFIGNDGNSYRENGQCSFDSFFEGYDLIQEVELTVKPIFKKSEFTELIDLICQLKADGDLHYVNQNRLLNKVNAIKQKFEP